MKELKYLKTGITGTVLAAICCFTPFLVILLGVVGLSAWLGRLDYALFPLMYASMGLMTYSLYLRSDQTGPNPKVLIMLSVIALSGVLFWLEFKFALRITIATGALVALYAYLLHRQKAATTD